MEVKRRKHHAVQKTTMPDEYYYRYIKHSHGWEEQYQYVSCTFLADAKVFSVSLWKNNHTL